MTLIFVFSSLKRDKIARDIVALVNLVVTQVVCFALAYKFDLHASLNAKEEVPLLLEDAALIFLTSLFSVVIFLSKKSLVDVMNEVRTPSRYVEFKALSSLPLFAVFNFCCDAFAG